MLGTAGHTGDGDGYSMTANHVTPEIGSEPVAYGRPAPDAFDLPGALAARERRTIHESRSGSGSATTSGVDAEELPPVFVPSPDR